MRASWRVWATIVLFSIGPVSRSFAQQAEQQGSPAAPSTDGQLALPAEALSSLQESHQEESVSFIVQDELDFLIANDGGGACASVAASDCLQVLRVMCHLEKVKNPHKEAISRFKERPDLLNGRLTNDQFSKLVVSYRPLLGGRDLDMHTISAPHSAHAADGRKWDLSAGPDLTVAPRELKVLSYTVTEESGHVIGRHFVLLKAFQADVVTVVDPSSPLKDRRYVLEFRGDRDKPKERIFLLNPAGVAPRKLVYELNTVFHISIAGHPETPAIEGDTVSAKSIKAEIDDTARELRGTADFLSPRAWRERTAASKLPGLDLPVDLGGAGWPASRMVEIFRHAGTHNLNFRDVVGGAHSRALLKSNNKEVLDVVRQVAAGRGYVAIAITEPTAGSDIPSISSVAKKVPGGFLLTGTKRFNARLDQATHVIIFTQGTTGKEGKLSVFLVPIGAKGLQIERLAAHGLTGNSYGGLKFNGLFVPDSHLIGKDGEGLRVFFEHFLYWRLMQTASAIGTGQDALQQMADRIKSRKAFGGPIARFTHLQQPIGQHTTELRMALSLAHETAALLDANKYAEARPMICGLKAEGVEIALSATDAATRAFGGEGYSTLVDLGDRLRDLNGLRIADGTTDVMRMEVVRGVYGREFWEMAIQAED